MSDGRRDMTEPQRVRTPRPHQPREIEVWNQAIEDAAYECKHLANAGDDLGAESCARIGRTLERRILGLRIERRDTPHDQEKPK